MRLTDYFNVLLNDTVNLGQVKLDSLNSRVEAVYRAVKADEQIGHLILGKTPQGSWAHKTIINPVGSNEFDANSMHLDRDCPMFGVSGILFPRGSRPRACGLRT